MVADVLRAVAAADSCLVEMRAQLAALVADITLHAVVGDRLKDCDRFLAEVNRSIELSTGLNLPDLWPSSRLVGYHFRANLFLVLISTSLQIVVQEIVGAGTETTSTTLEWAIVELIRHPNAMEQVTAELRCAFAELGVVAEQALGKLQYLQLVIQEGTLAATQLTSLCCSTVTCKSGLQ